MINNSWHLGFDGALFLQIPQDENLTSTAFYKLNLKRYVKDVSPAFIRFNPELSYIVFNTVIEKCKTYSEKNGIKLEVASDLESYVTSRELYIEKRYRLGNEIKSKNEKTGF